MNVYLIGFLILFSILILSFFIWKNVIGNQFSLALIFTLFIALILRIFVNSDSHLHEWDERYHALVGKNLALHPLKPTLFEHPVLGYDYKSWVGNHVWLNKPPVPLWGIAITTSVFGNNNWAVRLPSLVYGLLSIFLTFLIGRLLFSHKVGILAAYLHAINGVIIELAGGRISSDHVETAFIFFVELAIFLTIYFFEKKSKYTITILIGIVTGLAFLCKWYPAGLVFVVWFTAFLAWKNFTFSGLIKHGIILLYTASAATLPWFYFISVNYPEEAGFVMNKFIGAYSSSVENHSAPIYYYWHEIMFIYGELVYLIIGFALYSIFKKREFSKNLILIVWALIPVIIFSFAETKRYTYLLVAAPAFFVLTANVWFVFLDYVKTAKMKWIGYLVLLALIVLPLRLMIERTKLFNTSTTLSTSEKEQNSFMTALPEYEKMFDSNSLVFGLKENIELMFYTDVYAAYPKIPAQEKLLELKNQGFIIWYFENEKWTKF